MYRNLYRDSFGRISLSSSLFVVAVSGNQLFLVRTTPIHNEAKWAYEREMKRHVGKRLFLWNNYMLCYRVWFKYVEMGLQITSFTVNMQPYVPYIALGIAV